jgi:MFS transporter, DHA2 family, multidrug resistance protein
MTPVPALSLDHLRRRYGERYKWLVLLTVMVGMMASIVSSTIVNVAVPEMSRYFVIGQERAQWISAGFMVSMTLALSLTPWLLHSFGMRRTYLGAVLLLMLGGIGGGLSMNFSLMIGMRVAEGIAAGVMQTIPSVVVLRSFQPHEQGRAMGIFGFGVVLAPAIGPGVGGLLVEFFGWRSIFFVVVPFCITAILLARRFLPLSSREPGTRRALDWRGLLLLAFATLCLLNGLVELHQAGSIGPWLLLPAGFAGMAGFTWYQLRCAEPLLHLRLFAHRQFAMGATVAFVYGIALFGSTYLLPIFLQTALNYTASSAGFVLLPAGLAMACAMPVAGRLADRFPANRLVVCGILLMSASLLLMVSVTGTSPYLALLLWVATGRIGLSLILPALSIGTVRGLDPAAIPQATSMSSFMRQLGGVIGISAVGIGLEIRAAAHGVDMRSVGPINPAKLAAFDEIFVALALVMAAATFAAWFLKPAPHVHAGPASH